MDQKSVMPANQKFHRPILVALVLFIVWSLVLGLGFFSTMNTQVKHSQEMALNQAKALVDKDLMYRRWNAGLHGLYADVKRVEPNPYLDGLILHRDRQTTDGSLLTLINPAYMTRMVFAIQKKELGIDAKLTSLKPLNPGNAPDAWEAEALQQAEKGRLESTEVFAGQSPRLRYLRGLYVQESCLSCHAQQGYKVGDVRGGISVSVPLEQLHASTMQALKKQAINYVAIWLLGSLGIVFGYRNWRHKEELRIKADEKLRISQAHYSSIVKTAMDCIISMDAEGCIIDFNPMAEEVYGYRREEVLGQRLSEIIIPAKMRDQHEQGLQRYLKSGQTHMMNKRLELISIRRDGSEFPVELSVTESKDTSGQPIYTGYLRDITQRKQAENELINAKLDAEQANISKSTFLANMSHEIRTPMNGVIGMIDVLMNSHLTVEQQRMARIIRDSAQSQLGILNDILDFSKIEAGKLDMSIEPFAMSDVIRKTCEAFRTYAEQHGVNCQYEIDKSIPAALNGDSFRLRQILTNFVTNAIKFSSGLDHVGQVTLRAQLEKKIEKHNAEAYLVALSVTDNGIGMDEATRSNLFKPFTQADSSTTRKYGGTGLGLVISMRLAEVMDGHIEVDSEPGKGSRFVVRIPFELADDTQLHIETQAQQLPLNDVEVPTREQAVAQQRLILVAEDNDTNQEVIRQQLALLGYQCDIAADGQQAYKLWKTGEYSLVLSDIHMPIMDGYQLSQSIRTEEKRLEQPGVATERTPVLALTANVLKGEAERCHDAGMDAYLAKPVPLSELMGELVKWLPIKDQAENQRKNDGMNEEFDQPALQHELADFDINMLTKVVGDNPSMHTRLLKKFLSNSEERNNDLLAAVESVDLQTIGNIAHSLKSASRSVGAMRLGQVCEQLEKAGKAANSEAVNGLMPDFEQAYMIAREEIDGYLSRQ